MSGAEMDGGDADHYDQVAVVLAIDAGTGTLYVLEQDTLRGYSYETSHGDVLP